ncbi:MAG: hypothetical protein AB7G37_13790 [Solirubrobacteraceae bacterium]
MERLERDQRRSTVRQLRQSITKDARGRVSDGFLDGPIRSTSCQNTDGHERDLDSDTAAYDCIAVTERIGTQEEGYRFSATVDFEKGSYTWRLGG